jgi:hypothetical protein
MEVPCPDSCLILKMDIYFGTSVRVGGYVLNKFSIETPSQTPR